MIDSWLSQPPLYILSPNVELIFFPHYSSNPNSTFSKLDTSSIMKDSIIYYIYCMSSFFSIKLILFINAGNFFNEPLSKTRNRV